MKHVQSPKHQDMPTDASTPQTTPHHASPTYLQFTPFASSVDASFWHQLSALKLDTLKLDDRVLSINGTYAPGKVTRNDASSSKHSGTPVPLSARLWLSAKSLDVEEENVDERTGGDDVLNRRWTPLEFVSNGELHNKNTLEEFKGVDKGELLRSVGEKVRTERRPLSFERFSRPTNHFGISLCCWYSCGTLFANHPHRSSPTPPYSPPSYS